MGTLEVRQPVSFSTCVAAIHLFKMDAIEMDILSIKKLLSETYGTIKKANYQCECRYV